MSLKLGGEFRPGVLLRSVSFRWVLAARGEAPQAGFPILRERNRGGGKVENLLLVFHFSIRLRRRGCGNVGISPAVGEISKGLVESGGSVVLAFHAFHSPGIFHSALFHRGLRQRANNASLAFCIRRAASVSLLAAACFRSNSAVIPGFKLFSQAGKDVSFS